MAIRLLATYEFFDKDGHPAGTVRLPVVDYAQPDSGGKGATAGPAAERPNTSFDDGPQGPAVLLIPNATTASAATPDQSALATCRA